ncbi:homoserine kinase [Cinnamomum micranthum f. kanehirae]|uniref:Homoserine kinase n=1 Tax=Cinnamomum micranthum f. kanehirae TaxID=337451 RepID=A0A443PSL5_9MAGN|nr:homoserine kinase [Cinnamomum micranthum f. kanehirae]
MPLIPGMSAVKKAALEAGAFGCTISGAGPTAVAVTDDEKRGREIGERMSDWWQFQLRAALALALAWWHWCDHKVKDDVDDVGLGDRVMDYIGLH